MEQINSEILEIRIVNYQEVTKVNKYLKRKKLGSKITQVNINNNPEESQEEILMLVMETSCELSLERILHFKVKMALTFRTWLMGKTNSKI